MKLDQNTVAVVTGAASGIGRALAFGLAGKGSSLAIADLNEAGLDETAEQLQKSGVKVSAHVVDVSDPERVAAFAQEVTQYHGRANLLVNNAGMALLGSFDELSITDMEWLMSVNFWGVVYGVKHFLPILQQQPMAHIVNISSVFGLIGFPGQSAYCASKFAVRGFTESLRLELNGSNIRVSSVHPGGIKTNIAKNARLGSKTDRSKRAPAIDDFEKLSPTVPEAAAERIIRGILQNEARILIGNDAKFMDLLQRVFPQNYYKYIGRMMEKTLQKKVDF